MLENGLVFEKAAVNTTVSRLVQAPAERLKNLAHDHPQYAKMLARGAPVDLYTASVSLILHPWNPHAPTVHANYRYCACGGGRFVYFPLLWDRVLICPLTRLPFASVSLSSFFLL